MVACALKRRLSAEAMIQRPSGWGEGRVKRARRQKKGIPRCALSCNDLPAVPSELVLLIVERCKGEAVGDWLLQA